ncbi:unnamed protein product [Caenorhabditis sp. 36 PRJEB53466]|nr:unnamed protein product [Caenorhabditis sp. 36 PRJEB53466]
MSSSRQIGRTYFNQTVEELEADKCATEGILTALTSSLMTLNHSFVILIVFASFFLTAFAFRTLWKPNVFPKCAQILLWSALVNGFVHQCSMLIIRVMHSSLRFVYIAFQIVGACLVLFWVFYNVPFVGYVPTCVYPPQASLIRFYKTNVYRLIALFLILFASLVVLLVNRNREKRMIHIVYDTESRYKSYENFLTTRAVCLIIFSQIGCLASTSLGTGIIHMYELQMSESLFHFLVACMTGVTYSNFFLPIVICQQNSQIINRRRTTIGLLRQEKRTPEGHFISLGEAWK